MMYNNKSTENQRSICIYGLPFNYWKRVQKRLRKGLYGVSTILILLVSFIVLSYFIPSTESSFAANSTSNFLSSLTKPITKVTSGLNVTKPSVNATRLQQIPNNIAANVEKKIAANVEKIKNI